MIINELLRKWFHLPPEREIICASCETLKFQLEIERARVTQLLNRISAPPVTQQVESEEEVELKPIQTRRKFVPFAVRQQMMHSADEKTLEVLKTRWNEIHNPSPVAERPIPTEPEKLEILEKNEELEKELLSMGING